ncbi:MAG: folate/biopterin family MFS transporter [Nitrospira sp.]|jgi:MFS family permease|nr:MAG: folate/biopterin family MFS transporter [Nitrospira sp.]
MKLTGIYEWIDRNILSLGRELRLSYLPPLMVYMAYGISGLTGIVGTFFVKDYLGLSASFLAALGFWAGIPWALKMPIGHTVDLLWRWKSWLVGLGAGLLAVSLGIMAALIGNREAMTAMLPAEVWFVISALLSPIGYVIQDAVADAMTVEAVPRVDEKGQLFDEPTRKLMHTTMQTLGRVAIVGGGILVAMINVYVFSGTEGLPQAELVRLYKQVYLMALAIPFVSVLGVGVAWMLQRRHKAALIQQGFSPAQATEMVNVRGDGSEATKPNWWILGGSLVFALFTVTVGLGGFPYSEEIVFAGSMAIVLFLMARLVRELEPDKRFTLVGTAVVVFIFRAIPGTGPGATWWMIDHLKFDQQFLSILSLIGSTLTLAGMFVFRRFMAERSIAYVVGFLTVIGTVLTLPVVSMYYGLHEWTARMTGGFVDARFIALIDTALESPLGQISMIPMLAWIANSAPPNLKATFFAVMASFTNLALSLSQLGTKYLNDVYVVTREVHDQATGAIQTPADYSHLGSLLIAQLLLGLALPLTAIVFAKVTRFKSA